MVTGSMGGPSCQFKRTLIKSGGGGSGGGGRGGLGEGGGGEGGRGLGGGDLVPWGPVHLGGRAGARPRS
jgi:hypothetical protein